jgi:lipoprotein-anchoring transpeptidase ErfK/SrfK
MHKNTFFIGIFSYLLIATTSVIANIQSYSFFDHTKNYITDKYFKSYNNVIVVNISKQKLQLFKKGKLKKSYIISTSKKGAGQQAGSRKTPVGLHKICEKIGENAPQYAIFKGRKFTGGIWPKETPRYMHTKDYIVTRILRLEGLEPGINKGRNNSGILVDSKDRTIYIHGTTMEWKLGSPSTIGCIHMKSKDVVKLFDEVSVGTLVFITS